MAYSQITVQAHITADLDQIWKKWNTPADICNWNNASDDWYTPSAANDLRTGGAFSYRMAARDGSGAFDFEGVYDKIVPMERIAYTLGDGRKVIDSFVRKGNGVDVTVTFDAETENPLELQREGWQAILDNFKRYAEKA